jgi:hypothetical protein
MAHPVLILQCKVLIVSSMGVVACDCLSSNVVHPTLAIEILLGYGFCHGMRHLPHSSS